MLLYIARSRSCFSGGLYGVGFHIANMDLDMLVRKKILDMIIGKEKLQSSYLIIKVDQLWTTSTVASKQV